MKVDAKLVADLRRQNAWSQDELATAAGLTLRTIQRIENAGAASLQSAKAVASALEIDVADLRPEPSVNEPVVHRPTRWPYQGIRRRASYCVAGLPLYDIAFGPDRDRGERLGHARGVLALGDFATGIVAAGAVVRGGLVFGGVGFGIVGIGGVSLSLFAIGGLAIGGLALGGAAVGGTAIGGGAIGYYACGGGVVGRHVVSPFTQDPAAEDFLSRYGLTVVCPVPPKTEPPPLQ